MRTDGVVLTAAIAAVAFTISLWWLWRSRRRRPSTVQRAHSVWSPEVTGIVDAQIGWARRVVAGLPPQSRHDIDPLIRYLALRGTDSSLHVGVFGQYSAGKSTLINALLGATLLPSSARVTTTVATRLWPARTDGLTLTLASGARLSWSTPEFREWYTATVTPVEPAGIRAALGEIMRSPQVAATVSSIDVHVAGAVLGHDVVVTDTPGFDALDAGHFDRTRRVATDVDLAIVLIPANTPGSMSLQQFLRETLVDLRERTVFVLTKFRQVPAAERADLQEHIVSWLAEQGFSAATVIRADATDIAVAVRAGNTSAATDEYPPAAALAETQEIARQLRELAGDRRQSLLEATVTVLLDRLLAAVTATAEDHRRAVQQLRADLARIPIVELPTFLAYWEQRLTAAAEQCARGAIDAALGTSTPQLATVRDRAVQQIVDRNDVGAIIDELCTSSEQILRDWTSVALQRATADSTGKLRGEAASMESTFAAQYAELAALAGVTPQPPSLHPGLAPVAVPYVDLSTAFSHLRGAGARIESSLGFNRAVQAVAGAGVAGLLRRAHRALGGDGRARQRQLLHDAAQAMHASGHDAASRALRDSEPVLRALLTTAGRDLITRYRAGAGPVVDQLIAGYRDRVGQLDAELHRAAQAQAQAQRRQEALRRGGLFGLREVASVLPDVRDEVRSAATTP